MKPILFSTPMVQAILAGRKTQTRRVVKPQPAEEKCYGICTGTTGSNKNIGKVGFGNGGNKIEFIPVKYSVGDILWVRETWTKLYYVDESGYTHYDKEMMFYAADGVPDIELRDDNGFIEDDHRIKWRPSIFMPRETARIFLCVTDVWVERVQDITEADALAEGVEKLFDHMPKVEYEDWAKRTGEKSTQEEQSYKNYLWHGHFGRYGTGNKQSDAWEHQYSDYNSARDSFSSLWESINAKHGYGWDINPWVWVISFERVNISEDKG